ncbi:MAG: DJ-1/PfpI family protein [bacterium]
MALSDKKVLMVVPPENFEDGEYDVTRRVLEFKGVKVKVACSRLGEIRGIRQDVVVRPDAVVGDVKYYDYDAIVFVGGEGARMYFDHEKVLKLAKDAEHKVLGATSNAVAILANANILKGKKVTACDSVVGLLEAKGAIYTGQPVEVDGKILTADGPDHAENLGNAIIKSLAS